jgi:hypothetical protein
MIRVEHSSAVYNDTDIFQKICTDDQTWCFLCGFQKEVTDLCDDIIAITNRHNIPIGLLNGK